MQRHPARWRELFTYADELPSSDGAAVAVGVLDAASYLPVADVRDAVTAGLTAGSGTVRLAALAALAALDGVDAALARALFRPVGQGPGLVATKRANPERTVGPTNRDSRTARPRPAKPVLTRRCYALLVAT